MAASAWAAAVKRKTRPGGQPDGSSYMGAWGGWALAPNTASMGRDFRSHRIGRGSRAARSNHRRFFNTFWQGESGHRFSEKIMPKQKDRARSRPDEKAIFTLLCSGAIWVARNRLVGR